VNNWKEYKLENIIKVKHGYAFKGAFFSKEPTNDILLSPGNFHIGGGFKTDKFKYYNGTYPESYILKEGDIIVTMTDLSKEGDTLGYSAKIPPHNGIKYLHNQRLGLLELINNDFNIDFLYWLLRTRDYQQFIVSSATGTTVKHTSPTRICEYVFKAPDFDTQTAIAEILSSLDDKIELNNKINQELENLAQTLFKQWFIDFEFPNQNGDPYKSSGGEMVDSELGEIPKGWEVINIQDLGKIICGKTPSKKISEYYGSDMPFIKIPDMHKNTYIVNSIDNLSVKGYNSQTNKTLPKNSIVVSSIATVGLVSLTSMPSQTNQQINSIIPKVDWLTFYIYDLCKSLNDNFIQLASGGSATLNMNTSTFKNISILQPTEAVLKSYHFLVVSLFEQIEMNTKENQELTNLRDTLLPKLISGELEVNNHTF